MGSRTWWWSLLSRLVSIAPTSICFSSSERFSSPWRMDSAMPVSDVAPSAGSDGIAWSGQCEGIEKAVEGPGEAVKKDETGVARLAATGDAQSVARRRNRGGLKR